MKNIDDIVKLAITTLLALSTTAALADTANTQKMEKCYGIVKTAMNDCQTASQSCGGSATKDNQPDAFIFLPKGDCNRIVGGSLTPKKS